jgi:integrase
MNTKRGAPPLRGIPASPRRRGRGRPRGSIYWHAASERWCAQTPPDRRGRRRSKYFADEDDAWRWLDAQVDALDDGIAVVAGSEQLRTYLRRWLDRAKRDPERDWSPSTRRSYTWAVEHLAAHRHARTPVGDLVRDHTDIILLDLASHLSRKSVGLIRSLLRSPLEDLADAGVLRRNPVRRARPSRADDRQAAPCPWSEHDARAFLAEARRSSLRPALWWLLLSCGLRSGELRALTLADLDLAAGTLTVSKSIDVTGAVGPTKTRRPHTIDLPANVIAALRVHLAERRAIGGPLFQARPGRAIARETMVNELRRLRRQAGVPPLQRVHDLRHVAASLMLANGYPVPTVAAILGHSTPAMTLQIYAHAVPRHVVRAPRNIADILPFAREGAAPAVDPAVGPRHRPPGPTTRPALTCL